MHSSQWLIAMSNWFHRPFGHRRKKDTSGDTRQPVEIKVRVDGKDIFKVTFHAEMVHADCKNSLLTHIHKRELQHDQVALVNKEGERVPCVYESFVSLGDSVLECSTKPKPWIRALERADLARYADPGAVLQSLIHPILLWYQSMVVKLATHVSIFHCVCSEKSDDFAIYCLLFSSDCSALFTQYCLCTHPQIFSALKRLYLGPRYCMHGFF